MKRYLADEEAMVAFGKELAKVLREGGAIVYLNGDLGAGKTTLVRGILTGLGHQGKVKSPTYTLVEPYLLSEMDTYHFDLYRLADPEELEYMGIRDYFAANTIALIEWPEKGKGIIPEADIVVNIGYALPGREMELSGNSPEGERIVAKMDK